MSQYQTDAIGVGILGYAFMGKAHANAYRAIADMSPPTPLLPQLHTIVLRIPATGRRTSWDAVTIVHIENGRW